MPSKPDHITRYRQAMNNLIRDVNDIQQIAVEAQRLGYPAALSAEDFIGAHSDITKEDYTESLATVVGVLQGISEVEKTSIYRIML